MKCFLTFALIGTAFAAVLRKKSVSGTATVNLGSNIGIPEHLASGWIYGIPDTLNQIPDHFYTDVGFRYGRAGGAQVVAPGRGWIWGLSEYKVCLFILAVRFQEYTNVDFVATPESIPKCLAQLPNDPQIQRPIHLLNPRPLGRRRDSKFFSTISRKQRRLG